MHEQQTCMWPCIYICITWLHDVDLSSYSCSPGCTQMNGPECICVINNDQHFELVNWHVAIGNCYVCNCTGMNQNG